MLQNSFVCNKIYNNISTLNWKSVQHLDEYSQHTFLISNIEGNFSFRTMHTLIYVSNSMVCDNNCQIKIISYAKLSFIFVNSCPSYQMTGFSNHFFALFPNVHRETRAVKTSTNKTLCPSSFFPYDLFFVHSQTRGFWRKQKLNYI